MITQRLSFLLLLLAALSLTACGGSSNESAENDTAEETAAAASSSADSESDEPESITEAMNEAQKALQESGATKEVVNFRELKKLLPESMMGMERTEFSGEKAGAFGFNMSNAQAKYQEGDKRIEVNIVDVAGVSAAMMGMASWATIEVDRESNEGYERTTTIDGHKAFEKYNTRQKSGELNLIVSERFIVSLEGRNIEEGDLRKALDQLSINKLAGLK